MARGVPRPVNDRVHDALVMRQVDLIRLANGTAATLLAGPLRQADERIIQRLLRIDDPARLTVKQRLAIEERLTNILAVQERQSRKSLNAYIVDLTGAELLDCESLLDRVFKPFKDVNVKSVSVGAAVGKVRRTPMRGVVVGRVLQRFFRNDRERTLATFRTGVTNGVNPQELVRSIVGTKSRRFLDGVRQVSRRSLETITQTITTHTSAQARSAIAEVNPDLIAEERWVSTLDGRTSAICRALDGDVFPVGEGIHPPAHPNCRSARMPIIPRLEAIPTADTTFLPSTIKESFDGKGPQILTYPEWLSRQSTGVQRDVLGPTRFKLWQEGMTMDKFVNDRGVQLTIPELRRRSPETFDLAGL